MGMKKGTVPRILKSHRARSVACLSVTVVVVCAGFGGATANAVPSIPGVTAEARSTDGSRIEGIEKVDDRNIRVKVYSAAMNRIIPVEVQRPADASAPRPSLYLLNGAGGGEDAASWDASSDARQFMKDKNVNLITPIGGKFTYYTDWNKDDPALGRNKWRTFLTQELPPLMDTALRTNHVNAIAGISTSATTVLALPIAAPGLYKAAAAYSGCAQTSDPLGSRFVRVAVAWGGGNAENMWGPVGSPEWSANDPYVHADKLRGVDLYLSSGNGMPGKYDTLNGAHALPGAGGLADQVLLGGLIESAANFCTHNLQTKLASLGIPVTYHSSAGTHSWGYWQDEFKRSWPVLAHGLGLS